MSSAEVELNSELQTLRNNADNLANCLSSLLKRIEDLETKTLVTNGSISENLNTKTLENQEANSAYSTFQGDPILESPTSNPYSARTHVSKHVHSSSYQIPINDFNENSKNVVSKEVKPSTSSRSNKDEDYTESRLLASAYESRIVIIKSNLLSKLEVEFRCGEAVVIKVDPTVVEQIHPGDTILEINGVPLTNKKQLYEWKPEEEVTLKLVLSDIYSAPMEFCKILQDYRCNGESTNVNKEDKNLPYLSFNLNKGDVLQILSVDKTYMQARKVNDLSTAGFVPSNIKVERVAMLSPYGRRCLVLLGAKGVGRRMLKEMLLDALPNDLATVVPITSRAPKHTEQEGREYNFHTKEHILRLIRAGNMIEWGDFNGQLYGTSAESVRRVVRSGRVCVLDCEPKALKYLYNREFMPYVVVITPPPSLTEFIQLNECRTLREDQKTSKLDFETAKTICEKSDALLQSDYAKYFHLVLVNRNRETTLKRLLDALEHLKNESQWIPVDWLD